MRLNPFIFGALVLALFLGTVVSAQALGQWSISGKVTATGEKITATGANPDEIKGWMTLQDVATAYTVDAKEIMAAFNLPADTPPTKQVKDLESDTFSVTQLRDWLKGRQGSQ